LVYTVSECESSSSCRSCCASHQLILSFWQFIGSVLIAYVVFVIADIAFHITPDKPYIEVLRDALSSGGGEDAAST
jgi:hypothetical protein